MRSWLLEAVAGGCPWRGGAEGRSSVLAKAHRCSQVAACDWMLRNEEQVSPLASAEDERGVIFVEAPLPAHACCFPRKPLAAFTAGTRRGMEIHAFGLVQLFLFVLWVNGLMNIGLAGAPQGIVCNESLMLQKLPVCGKSFEEMMRKVDSRKWCNLTEFILYYNNFTLCTEHEAATARCFWPNPLAEGFITGIHRQFFSNCSTEKIHWEDPPDKILITLIVIPVLLTMAMIGLVVWCSKRSDILV